MDAGVGSQTRNLPDQSYYTGEPVRVHDEVLQYAYENDLIRDHTLNSFSIAHQLSRLVQSTLPSVTEDGFTDCSQLPYLEIPNPQIRSEVLTISHSALKLIYDVRRDLTDDEVKSLTQGIIESANIRNMKLELPILRSDNERDMREFQKQMKSRRDVHIGDHRLPLDPVTVEDGEGMELSASARSEADNFLRKFEAEKLGVTRSSLQFLADVVKDDYIEEDQWSFLIEEAKKSKWVKVSKDAASFQISSIFADDLRDAEEQLFEDHGDVWSEPTSPILDKFLDLELSKEQEMECFKDAFKQQPTKRDIDDHKIDLPLLPDLSPEKQLLRGPDAFGEFVAEELDIEDLAKAFVGNFSDDKFEDQLADLGDSMTKTIEQEQLQAADAIARVAVPIMDFSIAEPEWVRLGNNGPAIFKWIQCGNDSLFRFPKWPRDNVTESKMTWMPIASGASTVSTNMEIEAADTLVETFIEPLDTTDVPNSFAFVQKRDRLAILKYNAEDDEIEAQVMEPKPCTKIALVMGRKRALDPVDNISSKKPRPSADFVVGKGQSLLLGGSPGASAKLLTNFMELHAPKKKWSVSKYFPSTEKGAAALPCPPESSGKPRGTSQNEIAVRAEAAARMKGANRAPYPPFKPMSTPLTIFISLSAPRHLIRALDGLLPGLSLMERDYHKHNTSVWSPGSVSRTEVFPPLAYDADVTLSPSTGVITTSMIVVRQKPRPQSTKNGLQERIEKVSLRYERLIILVGGGGGSDDSFREMAASDAAALTDFQGFVNGLNCNVLVYYIGGGDSTLSRWVASLACRYGHTDSSVQDCLIEVETLWELWLRRAGLNVYAAQMIAGQLKVPKTETDMARGHHGLAAFTTMTRNERMRRFGPMVGPRVLARVSQTVDEIWNKA
ncbi:hypothetical protein Daus18300_007806 [Diaporthe australafricana]|uniref:Uncharacterized protein n=1 Tax=Diaporthe australafricana TaxID=127596 RepID=A0ABR3WLD3_9PEZI